VKHVALAPCFLALFLAGCFDSIVSAPCAAGYSYIDGHCAARPGADAPVAPPDGATVQPPDALMCSAPEVACDGACKDVSSDPDNCGACDRVCASGICTAGHCAGELSGHIVAIGHDYTSHHAAMARVLGNAVALGAHADVGVARWRGQADALAVAGTTAAFTQAMSQIGRPWHAVQLGQVPSDAAFTGVDVLLVDAQTGNGDEAAASAAPWATAVDRFLQRGGIVIVLAGAGGVSHRVAAALNVFALPEPADSTGVPTTISDPADALAQQVVSPYLAETSSVVYAPALPGAVIATPAGTLAFHVTRY
jgi:hypothetical protein